MNMRPEDYMTPEEAHELDACPVCDRMNCICPEEIPDTEGGTDVRVHHAVPSSNLSLEQTESLCDWYDHTWAESPAVDIDRYWEEEPNLWGPRQRETERQREREAHG